jgi:hypothetical protein
MTTQNSVRLRRVLTRHWKSISAYLLVFLITGSALVWQLKDLLPGYSKHEVAAYNASLHVHDIWTNPFNAPYHLVVHILNYVFPDNLITVRLTSVLIGWLSLLVFCALAYRWFGTRTALIGTLLFGTSGTFLHTARLGVPTACFFGIIGLVACGVWLRERKAGLAVILGIFLTTALLYTPGMVWFITLGLLWQWRYIDKAFKQHLGFVTLGGFIFIAGLLPLGWKLYKTPTLIRDWLCLPDSWSITHMLHNLIDVPLAIFVRGQVDPENWLGRLPVLSIFSVVAFILGAYVFYKHFKLARTKLFIVLALLGSVVIAVTNGATPLITLVPFVYMVVALGASRFIGMWLDVFPRNPIARGLGIGLFSVVLGVTSFYNLRSYFVAWPQATVTRNEFREHL